MTGLQYSKCFPGGFQAMKTVLKAVGSSGSALLPYPATFGTTRHSFHLSPVSCHYLRFIELKCPKRRLFVGFAAVRGVQLARAV